MRCRTHHRRMYHSLLCQALEPRQLLTALFVTPLDAATDTTHFHTLADAVAAAHAADVITLMDGAISDPGPVGLSVAGITVQGDPNLPPSDFPRESFAVTASNITLRNLNVDDLNIALGNTLTGTHVLKNNIVNIDTGAAPSGMGSNIYDSNYITGICTFNGNTGGTATSDMFINNTIVSHVANALNFNHDSGLLVQNNSLLSDGAAAEGIFLDNCGLNTVIANNTVTLPNGIYGIYVQNSDNTADTIVVRNNTLSTNLKGSGVAINAFGDSNMQALVEGNNVQNNLDGVHYMGSSGVIATDLGGGTLGSKGGNNFRTFTNAAAGSGRYAILVDTGASTHSLSAHNNIFTPGVTLATVTHTNGATIDVTALAPSAAFVVTLYNSLLGRTPSVSDMNFWANTYTLSGQAAVVNGILHSAESFTRIVNSYYTTYLGHGGDPGGLTFWTNQLLAGASLESVQIGFLSSAEFIATHNSDFVQSLYRAVLHRTADSTGFTYWYSQLPTLGLSGIAGSILNSGESRTDVISAYFKAYLHRNAGAGDVSFFLTQGGFLNIQAQIFSSGEYFTNG